MKEGITRPEGTRDSVGEASYCFLPMDPSMDQSGYEASGGPGVLRGGYPQQWPGCPGDHGQQTQQRASEAHEGAEYSQTGQPAS